VRAREAGFIVNPVAPAAIRLAPPLVITAEQVDTFVAALPALLDAAARETSTPTAPSTDPTEATR
jgi:acetylornithine aminotransferase